MTVGEGLPELITDRAIDKAEDDLLGHEDFVNRLLKIVGGTKTPANVALFGRWGSGKTGIAKRLEGELKKRNEFERFEFAYFDAFKLARLPLLRRFLVQIARSLGGEPMAAKYRCLIYERVERVRLSRPMDELKGPLIYWATIALWIVAGLIGLFDLIAYLATGGQLHIMLKIAQAILPILLPAGLLVALSAFGLRYLTASTTAETPSSEEQFENLFTELLAKYEIGPEADQKTLVVFVDELDRCSAVEVARTLESLKTFLDQPGCIFILAADQRVLEHALTTRVRQATPRDLGNPYYSAGSAYLDKIFQYQLTLPPLFPGRLIDFALHLLKGVGGAWNEVESKEDVISVLLPVQVRSPRRVKVLLNAFAQTFALALARSKSEDLDENIGARADEVARLVGLQVEFPLFAEDLSLHRDLPDLVLKCAEAEEPETLPEMRSILPTTRKRVLGFARGELATDAALGGNGPSDEEMKFAQGADLIDYLRQTSRVEGPKIDIIHLERLGRTIGMDEALAVELTELALKNSAALVKEILEGLSDEERARAFNLLRDLVRRSKGNDVANVLHTLLICWPLAENPNTGVVRDLLTAVNNHQRGVGLQEDELASAFDIAIRGRDRQLQRRIAEREEAWSEPLRARVLDHADSSPPGQDSARLGVLMAREIVEAPETAAKRISRMRSAPRKRLLRAAAAYLAEIAEQIEVELSAEGVPELRIEERGEQLRQLVDGVSSAFDALIDADVQADAETLLLPLLEQAHRDSDRAAIERALARIEKADGREFNVALAKWLSHRPTATLLEHGRKLDGGKIGDSATAELGEIVARLWHEGVGEEDEAARTGLELISELRGSGAELASGRLGEAVRESFEPAVLDEAGVARERGKIDLLNLMVAEGLLGDSEAADVLVDAVTRGLAQELPPGNEPALAELLVEMLEWAPDHAAPERLRATREALTSSPWITAQAPYFQTLRLQVEAGLGRGGTPDPPFDVDELAEWTEAHRYAFAAGAALWLERFDPSPAAAAKVLQPYFTRALRKPLAGAVSRYSQGLTSAGRFRLLRGPLRRPRPNPRLLRQLGIEDADPERVTTAIVDRFMHARRNPEREAALKIWRSFSPHMLQHPGKYRIRLIREVFIPFCVMNIGGYEMSRRYLDLCKRPPRGTKEEILEALAKAPDPKRLEKMRKRMKGIGLRPLPKG